MKSDMGMAVASVGNLFSGSKTYIVAILIAAITVANQFGWISPETYTLIMGLLGSLGLGTLRHGVAKSKK